MTQQKIPKKMDDFLSTRLDKYTAWLDDRKIAYSSKIVPVRESLENKQWILPTEQVLEIIASAATIALTDCLCRSHYKKCDHPVDVCILLNQYGRKCIDKGQGREISLDEAARVLDTANRQGLVHLSLYRPDHQLYALCSCCSCCCHDLQLLLDYKQDTLVVHADYAAQTDMDQCIHCGECIARCAFKARKLENDAMVYNTKNCYGCGLCVTTCPVGATMMKPK
jgi:Pyruvate/2-oxoacid:ferredoxin oxidoreductase delta subunit